MRLDSEMDMPRPIGLGGSPESWVMLIRRLFQMSVTGASSYRNTAEYIVMPNRICSGFYNFVEAILGVNMCVKHMLMQ